MERWDKKGLPHKGWAYLGSEDFEDDYQICEMCGKTNIRYIHYLKHEETEEPIKVGCECASKLCDEYVDFQQHERDLRNKFNRKKNYLKQCWITKVSSKGNRYLFLRYKGKSLYIMEGKYGKFGIAYPGSKSYDFSHNLHNVEMAKQKIYELVFS